MDDSHAIFHVDRRDCLSSNGGCVVRSGPNVGAGFGCGGKVLVVVEVVLFPPRVRVGFKLAHRAAHEVGEGERARLCAGRVGRQQRLRVGDLRDAPPRGAVAVEQRGARERRAEFERRLAFVTAASSDSGGARASSGEGP